MTPEDLFAGHPDGLAVLHRVRALVGANGPAEVRASRSQVAFRRRHGFAWLWRPAQYLAHAEPAAVLSIALGRLDGSLRWKEVAHPTPRHWIHHLEVRDPAELDAQVAAWLREAADRAG